VDGFGKTSANWPVMFGKSPPARTSTPTNQNPPSRFLLHIPMAAAEFERELIRERTLAGQQRYRQDYAAGKVGKTVCSRSGRNLPLHRPKKVFDRDEVMRLRHQGRSYRQIAESLGLGVGTVARTMQAAAKTLQSRF
jgi:DNA invertase Pin-like site-specific DNA recombinase